MRTINDEYGQPTHDGLLFLDASVDQPSESQIPPSDLGSDVLLTQLVDDGYAQFASPGAIILPWPRLYDLLEDESYVSSIAQLGLPPQEHWAPTLRERGSITDRDFGINVIGWLGPERKEYRGTPEVTGAFIQGRSLALLSKDSYRLIRELTDFAKRPADKRSSRDNQLGWSRIRKAALTAKATLSDYLRKTVVVTPEQLQIHLRRNPSEGVLEVTPAFEEQPPGWLLSFDRLSLRERYDIPNGETMTHVIFTPEALSVLEEIKAMPGRRVSGERASSFVRNPYTFLGDKAAELIDPVQIETSLLDAGVGATRFFVEDRTNSGCVASMTIVETIAGEATSSRVEFTTQKELEHFVTRFRAAASRGNGLFLWDGYEFDLLGDYESELHKLELILGRPQATGNISLADVLDLSQYTDRNEGFGIDKPFYSPYIARTNNDDGWIPDNVDFGFQFQGEDGPVAISLDDERIELLEARLTEAKASQASSFEFPGCPRPISTNSAEDMLNHIRAAKQDVAERTFTAEDVPKDRVKKHTLLIKPNVDTEDYVIRRGNIGVFNPTQVTLPLSLSAQTQLKPHQLEGLAWLQHLWSLSAENCRGALLADDMGLGKSLQILSFIAWLIEHDQELEPVLIVAPVSLLDNWIAELDKFFKPGALPYLKLYGNEKLSRLASQNSIDLGARDLGFGKFLTPNWIGSAKLVFTNYETLRELELSLAREDWSVMVCDEAHFVKNPNALVTKAAKKQKSHFMIACTGTPVENTLADLWSLFDLIQPGLLPPLNVFGSKYRRPIESSSERQLERLEELRTLIQPQTLRRMKRDVAKDLPAKHEDVACKTLEMSARQRQQFANLVQRLKRRAAANSGNAPRFGIDSLHELKQFFAHPTDIGQTVITNAPVEQVVRDSPKMIWLLDTLRVIKESNEKALIFCELKDLQRTLQHVVRSHFGIQVDIVNGDSSTRASDDYGRQRRIDRFQSANGFGVIILSPLVAGFGLNIQAANHVIHFTRLWNPAKEDQATDRAYRIGQTKDVYVYCPVVTSPDFTTFDVKLDRLLEAKRLLSEDMLNGTSAVSAADFANLEDVDGVPFIPDVPITEADLVTMHPKAFEAFCAALWAQRGYTTNLTPPSDDGGVDVVAIKGADGLLIQCKTSRTPDHALGWDAVKDVAAGAQRYTKHYGAVVFRKLAITNQRFNHRAREQAEHNQVELVERKDIVALLNLAPVMRSQLEALL